MLISVVQKNPPGCVGGCGVTHRFRLRTGSCRSKPVLQRPPSSTPASTNQLQAPLETCLESTPYKRRSIITSWACKLGFSSGHGAMEPRNRTAAALETEGSLGLLHGGTCQGQEELPQRRHGSAVEGVGWSWWRCPLAPKKGKVLQCWFSVRVGTGLRWNPT